jgi:hypothetical protein
MCFDFPATSASNSWADFAGIFRSTRGAFLEHEQDALTATKMFVCAVGIYFPISLTREGSVRLPMRRPPQPLPHSLA